MLPHLFQVCEGMQICRTLGVSLGLGKHAVWIVSRNSVTLGVSNVSNRGSVRLRLRVADLRVRLEFF